MEGRANGHYMHVGSERFHRWNDIRADHAAADKMELDYYAVRTVLTRLTREMATCIGKHGRHFAVRRLERTCGAATTRALCEQAALKIPAKRRKPVGRQTAASHG